MAEHKTTEQEYKLKMTALRKEIQQEVSTKKKSAPQGYLLRGTDGSRCVLFEVLRCGTLHFPNTRQGNDVC